jgi:hypothetical protein
MYQEPDKIDYPELDPDYYLKKFLPVWKQYMLFLKIFLAILIATFILIFSLKPDSIYFRYGFITFMVTACLISLYFLYKLRCPKCGRYPVGGMFPLTGECPGCGVQLKNRLVSNETAKVIKISIIAILIVGMLAALYRMFNP